MATVVILHAHPDDESIGTGGVIAKAVAERHRVVLVVATNGEEGEPVAGVLAPGEELGDRRRVEAQAAAELLGVHRLIFLGYRDSGMMDTAPNDHPDCFWRADIDEAANRVAELLREEHADVLVVYDDNGVYGHPDHIQVFRVGLRAAEMVGSIRLLEMSPNRDEMRRSMQQRAAQLADGEIGGGDADEAGELINAEFVESFGLPETELTHRVDVGQFVVLKRRALAAHASQVGPDHPMLSMPLEGFAKWAGVEWFRDRSRPRHGGDFLDDIFA